MIKFNADSEVIDGTNIRSELYALINICSLINHIFRYENNNSMVLVALSQCISRCVGWNVNNCRLTI